MSKRSKSTVQVGSADFKARCLELIDRVKESRAEIVVTRHGRPVARLVPCEDVPEQSPVGSMPGSVLAFDAPFDPVPGAWSIDAPDE